MDDEPKPEKTDGEEATAKSFRSGARVKHYDTKQVEEEALKIRTGPDQAEHSPKTSSEKSAKDQQPQPVIDAARSGAKVKRYATGELGEEADDFVAGPDQAV